MSRADDVRERYDAELAVIELEEELVRLKGLSKPDPEALEKAKADLREARRAWRELRAGAVEASPETVTATAVVSDGEE